MNFYIVPSGLYQTQQKLKGKTKKNTRHKPSRGSQTSRNSSETKSSLSESINLRNLIESLRPTSSEMHYHNNVEASVPSLESQKSNLTGHMCASHPSTSLKMKEIQHNKNLNFLQVPAASLIFSPSCGGIEIKPREGLKESSAGLMKNDIPQYEIISSVADLNSETSLKRKFLTPSFQLMRYKNYLELFENQHEADSVSYADVRMQSFGRFITKLSYRKNESEIYRERDAELYHHEGILACELFKCRKFIRSLLHLQLGNELKAEAFYLPEELIQANFTNYVRYLLSLPFSLPDFCDHLDPIIVSHYNFKSTFQDLRTQMQSIAQDGIGSETLSLPGADLIVQAITKVLYEYILLEQYHIDVLAKLGCNSLVDRRIVKLLFNLFSLNMKLENTESLKILNFNIFFSAQYSWYLALTIPFVRVFESNIFMKDEKADDGSALPKHPFYLSDSDLYNSFFKKLQFDNFEEYNKMTKAELIKTRRDLEDIDSKFEEANFDVRQRRHKPNNFEYLNQSIFTVQSETFHVIQSRDIYLQLNQNNYRGLLREFHRILKKGGILELPMYMPQFSPERDSNTTRIPVESSDKIYRQDESLVPDFLNSIIRELHVIFGSKNVMFGGALVSPDSKMNAFVTSHISLRLHDMYDDMDSFLTEFTNQESVTNESGNYLFYIRSEKN